MDECRQCQVILNSGNWYPSFRERNNRICIVCQNHNMVTHPNRPLHVRKYYLENETRIKEKRAAFYEANKDTIRGKSRTYIRGWRKKMKEENPEAYSAMVRKNSQDHRDRIKADPEKYTLHLERDRLRKRKDK